MPMQSFKNDVTRIYYVDSGGSGLVMYADQISGLAIRARVVATVGVLTNAQRLTRNDLLSFEGAQIRESDTGKTYEVKNGAWVGATTNIQSEGGVSRLGFGTAPVVADLPAASAAYKGYRGFVTDASVAYTSANVGTIVAGGGANSVPVFCNGTNWVIG